MYSVVYGRVRPGASPATVVHLEILRSQSRPKIMTARPETLKVPVLSRSGTRAGALQTAHARRRVGRAGGLLRRAPPGSSWA